MRPRFLASEGELLALESLRTYWEARGQRLVVLPGTLEYEYAVAINRRAKEELYAACRKEWPHVPTTPYAKRAA